MKSRGTKELKSDSFAADGIREGIEYDEVRDDFLISLGLTVVRFDNEEIEENIEKVIYRIKENIAV